MGLRSGVVVVLAAAGAIGCGTVGPPGEGSRIGNATVIDAEKMNVSGGSVLTALRSNVSSLRIQQGDFCPEIIMRGKKSISHPTNPLVYVDGTRAANTCVLQSLQATEVERVEIYPGGVTRRPSYRTHPGGLILIFMKGSGSGLAGSTGR